MAKISKMVRSIECQAMDDLKTLANAREDEEIYIEYGIEKAKIILDYITYLQQENERLKDELEWYKQECYDLALNGGVDNE